jgi:hypothetical protein
MQADKVTRNKKAEDIKVDTRQLTHWERIDENDRRITDSENPDVAICEHAD